MGTFITNPPTRQTSSLRSSAPATSWPSWGGRSSSGKNKVLRAFTVGFVLLALIGGSVWWFGYSQHTVIKQLSADARHITKQKIRGQLLESVDRTRLATLAEAKKANGWEERERLARLLKRPTPEASPALMNWPLPARSGFRPFLSTWRARHS